MASSTRSRNRRKSRANAHMPGAARVRPRMQHIFSTNAQNTSAITTNNGNLVTLHIPPIATQANTIKTILPQSLPACEIQRDDIRNKMSSSPTLTKPFSGSVKLHTAQ